jgi:ribose/xylose/arabinose/galactoside ABC-type transport system permease subunit
VKRSNSLRKSRNGGIYFYFGDHAIVIALVVFWVALFFTNSAFSSFSNYSAIIKEASIFAVAGIGMTFAVISGVFDLSIASQIALSSVVFTAILPRITPEIPGLGIVLSCVVIIIMGVAMGLINGLLVANLRIPAFITTLAMQMVYRGLAQFVNNSPVPISSLGNEYRSFTATAMEDVVRWQVGGVELFFGRGFGGTRLFGFPLFFYIMIALALIGTVILRKTGIGRNILAIGNSREAAHIAGINVPRTQIITFVMVGLFTAFAGIMMTSHHGSSNYGVPSGTEFTVISAVVLGGTALAGGKGSILNTVIAALFIATISTALTGFGIDNNIHGIFNGAILVFAFSINTIRSYADDAFVKFLANRDIKAIANKTAATK